MPAINLAVVVSLLVMLATDACTNQPNTFFHRIEHFYQNQMKSLATGQIELPITSHLSVTTTAALQ